MSNATGQWGESLSELVQCHVTEIYKIWAMAIRGFIAIWPYVNYIVSMGKLTRAELDEVIKISLAVTHLSH